VLNLHAGGRLIETTAERPFYVESRGWVPAAELRIGDAIPTSDGAWVKVEGVAGSGRVETVYNLEVEQDHTYFVGAPAREAADRRDRDVRGRVAVRLNVPGRGRSLPGHECFAPVPPPRLAPAIAAMTGHGESPHQ
jgi:hypothetical protein